MGKKLVGENENSVAELLYTLWAPPLESSFQGLSDEYRERWKRVARFVLQREVILATEWAEERGRKRITERLLKRLQRWAGEK